MRRKSKRCSRDRIGAAVLAIFCGSVVAKTKTTRGGGSSRIFQQRIPRLAGEHMRLVDDIDLGPGLGARGVHRPLAQVARVIHAAVGGRVELDHVQIGRARPDAPARIAFAAGLAGCRRGTALAIEGHREDAGGGRFPDASGAGKEVAVCDPALRHRSAECGGDVWSWAMRSVNCLGRYFRANAIISGI